MGVRRLLGSPRVTLRTRPLATCGPRACVYRLCGGASVWGVPFGCGQAKGTISQIILPIFAETPSLIQDVYERLAIVGKSRDRRGGELKVLAAIETGEASSVALDA